MEPERMVAVKKAYAEIILNTAKEAAARVMAAERRALRFEHDLRATKDEALQMLLRLKQMIDSKTSEAQMTSFKQEKKIEELEAQLYEVEDIITDLRSELKQAWCELERVSSNDVQPLKGETTREYASFSGNVTPEPMTLSPAGSQHEDAPSSGLMSTSISGGLDPNVSNGLEQTEQQLSGKITSEEASISENFTPEPMVLSTSDLGHEDAPRSGLKNMSVTRGSDHKILKQTEQQLSAQTTIEDGSFLGNVTPKPMTLAPSGLGHEDAPSSGLTNLAVTRGLEYKVSNGLEQTEQQLSGQTTMEDASFSGNLTPEPMTLSPSGLGQEDAPSSGLQNMSVTRDLDHEVFNRLQQTEQQLSISNLDKFCSPACDFDSVIMRSKEPELLKNGCTQRVRAFERNSFDGKLPLSGYEDIHKSEGKNELIVKASDNGMDLVKKPSLGETKAPVKVRTIRRKKTQFEEAKTSHLCRPNQQMSSCQPSSVDGRDRSHKDACMPPSVEDITRFSNGLHGSCHPIDSKIMHMAKRKRIIQGKDGIIPSFTSDVQPSPVLSRCRTVTYLINGDVKSCEDRPNTAEKNEVKVKPLPRLDAGRTLIRRDVDPTSGSNSVKISIKGITKSGPVQNDADKGNKLIDVSVSIKPGKDVVETSEAPSSEVIVGTGVISGMNTELTDVKVPEQSSESLNHVSNSELLKRKRKNSSSNPDGTASFEENTTRRRTRESECIAPQPQNESSRDSRRLAQVARQLISLSGKRWYK